MDIAANNSVNSGTGNDTIFAGLYNDTISGGSGNDTFAFDGSGVGLGSLVKSTSNSETLTDFVSGVDDIVFAVEQSVVFSKSIGSSATYNTTFNGNKANFSQAQASITAGTAGNLQVVYEQDTHTLWADTNHDGKLDNTDLQINLSNNPKTLTAADVGATAVTPPLVTTTGNNITLTAPNAQVSNISKVNASNVTTAGDDTITSTVANLANTTIDGGAGTDILVLSDVSDMSLFSLFTTTKNVEVLKLANGANHINVIGYSFGNSSIPPNSSISTIIGGSGNDNIEFYAKNVSVDAGDGDDNITIDSNATITGGSGKDVFTVQMLSSSGDAISKATFADIISGTDKINFTAIQLSVSTTTNVSSTSSIVGAWKATTPLGDAVATFMSDGTYFYADPQGGAEKGTYSWDSAKSSFSVTGNTFDTSKLGFYPSSTPTAVTFSGTSASWTVQGVKITANPITDSAKQLVGSWYAKGLGQSGGDQIFTFLSDGTYYLVDNGDPALDPSGKKGMEKGTYTWDSSTSSFNITGVTVDTNGQWGFSDLTVAEKSASSTVTVTGDTLSFGSIGKLTKVVSPTTAPTTTTSMVNASVSFLGNQADFAQAQKAIVANASKLQVVYEQDTHTLWADVNNDGVLNTSDLQITLNGVNTLAATDFV